MTESARQLLAARDPQTILDAYAGELWPDEQVRVFANTDRMFPTRLIKRGNRKKALPYAPNALKRFSFACAGKAFDLYDYVSRNRVAGLLIAKQGEIVLEQYHLGITEHTRWVSMSMAKSISSTLVGAAIHDGSIERIDDPLTRYLPELAHGSYEGVTVRQLLCMTSGVQWNEEHTDPASDRRRMLELQIAGQPGAILKFMSELPRVAAPGSRWNYSTGETYVVGQLLRAATGRWLADYLSEKIWSPAGMESDASWWLESADGLEVAGAGISATLRDYARFGSFVLDGGQLGSRRVLPEGWVSEAGAPREIASDRIGYGYMWWPVPSSDSTFAGAFSARGIFGQRIYINPARRLIVVVFSARSKPRDSETIVDNDFFNAVAEAL